LARTLQKVNFFRFCDCSFVASRTRLGKFSLCVFFGCKKIECWEVVIQIFSILDPSMCDSE
jgi:hypothetical protein